jgi:hypothetical protein
MTNKHNLFIDEDHEERVHNSTTMKVSLNPNGVGMVAVSHNKEEFTNTFFVTDRGYSIWTEDSTKVSRFKGQFQQ